MNTQQTIPCPTPNCGGQIAIEARMLLQGSQFVCPNCNGTVGLATESRQVVEETIDKFDTMKQELLKKKEDNSMT